MRKIPSLFERNWTGALKDRSLCIPEVTKDAAWVLGEPEADYQPMIKWDGTPVMVRAGRLFKRFDAKRGKTPPSDMAGGTFSITNVGVFGVDTGTPILPPGESAILCFGVIRPTPWVHKGKIKVRQVTTLGLSFDHRIIDGELGSKFLRDIGRFLEDPEEALLSWT